MNSGECVLINVLYLLVCSLLSQLRKAVMDHISDSFLETNVPLLVLIEAAKSGNEKEVKEYAQVFREHANKLVEVSDLSGTARFPSGTSRRDKKSDKLGEMLEVLFQEFWSTLSWRLPRRCSDDGQRKVLCFCSSLKQLSWLEMVFPAVCQKT